MKVTLITSILAAVVAGQTTNSRVSTTSTATNSAVTVSVDGCVVNGGSAGTFTLPSGQCSTTTATTTLSSSSSTDDSGAAQTSDSSSGDGNDGGSGSGSGSDSTATSDGGSQPASTAVAGGADSLFASGFAGVLGAVGIAAVFAL